MTPDPIGWMSSQLKQYGLRYWRVRGWHSELERGFVLMATKGATEVRTHIPDLFRMPPSLDAREEAVKEVIEDFLLEIMEAEISGATGV